MALAVTPEQEETTLMTRNMCRIAAGLCALIAGLLAGCQALDVYANLNRRPARQKPAMVGREHTGRAPVLAPAGDRRERGTNRSETEGGSASVSAKAAPAPGQINVERAETLRSQGLLEEALREFKKAIEINPRLTVAYLGAGDIYREKGDYASAEQRYAMAAQLEPQNFSAQYLHGLTLQLLGRTSESVRAYLRALAIRPADFNANMNLGIAYLQLGEPGEALGYLQRAVNLEPRNAAARTNLGAAYSALDRHEEAVIEYQQAAELAELSGPVLLNLANSLGRCKRYEEMVNTLGQLTRTEPTANAYERLGAGLFHLRRYDESLAAYRKALEIDPNHYPALNGVGVCLMNQWHFSDQRDEQARREALAAWRKSLQIERNQPKILELIGRYK
jgi:tetratricopeptide (TPR) repeat protein